MLFHRARAAEAQTGFLDRAVTVGHDTYKYRVYVPPAYSPAETWPIVLFLHGTGDRGSDGVKPTREGLGPAIRKTPSAFPAIVVFPQARRGHFWDREMIAQAVAALDASTAEFHGDPDRTYLTGLSMGGNGAWFLAAAQPQRFAALVVISGFVGLPGVPPPGELEFLRGGTDPYHAVAERVRHLPIRIYHGAKDRKVPPTEALNMAAALKDVGADPFLQLYEGVGHNAWDRAYAEPDLAKWLLDQRRRR